MMACSRSGRPASTSGESPIWRASCAWQETPDSDEAKMRRIGPGRAARARGALAVCGVLALSACAAKYVQVPPRLDLEPYGRIALITFSAEQANPGLGTLATQRFAEAVLASQSGIELLELGPADSALGEPGAEGDAGAFARALGRERDVPAVFVGHLSLSGIKPRGRLSAS